MDRRAHPDLLPCPHCGGRAVLIQPGYDDDDDEALVECDGCGMSTALFLTASSAIDEWNQRAEPKTPETHITADLEQLQTDALRYRWLRDGGAYYPEEQGVIGGDALDDLIDHAIANGLKWPC